MIKRLLDVIFSAFGRGNYAAVKRGSAGMKTLEHYGCVGSV
jgi:hypothetical protein